MLKFSISIFLFGITVFISAGCSVFDSLPPGIPPDGDIVELHSQKSRPLSETEAINQMTTSLYMYALRMRGKLPHLVSVRVSDGMKGKFRDLSLQVLQELESDGIFRTRSASKDEGATFIIECSAIAVESTEDRSLSRWSMVLFSMSDATNVMWSGSLLVESIPKSGQ